MSDVTGNENESLADSALRRYESDNSLGADEIRALAQRVLELEAELERVHLNIQANCAEMDLLMAVAEAAAKYRGCTLESGRISERAIQFDAAIAAWRGR